MSQCRTHIKELIALCPKNEAFAQKKQTRRERKKNDVQGHVCVKTRQQVQWNETRKRCINTINYNTFIKSPPCSEQRTLTTNAGRDYTRESRKWWNRFYFWKWNLTVYYMKRRLFARTKASLLFSLAGFFKGVYVLPKSILPRFAGISLLWLFYYYSQWLICIRCDIKIVICRALHTKN